MIKINIQTEFSKMNQYLNKKSFCKVCQDAGKNELEYNSHNLKNEKGLIICPTLLDLNCRYCFKKGHTVKYCPTLAKCNKEEKQLNNRNNYKNNIEKIIINNKANNKKTKKNNSRFQALCDDSTDEEKDEIKDLIEFPSLNQNKTIKTNNVLSYKNIITLTREKELEQKRQKEEAFLLSCINEKKFNKEEIKVIAAPINTFIPIKKRNWADVYSSDEEEEDNFCSNYSNPYDSN
jgi:hypothetical protein